MHTHLKQFSQGGWREKILHSFWDPKDGMRPAADVLLDSAGNVYGTTSAGGPAGIGTVFELSPAHGNHWKKTTLYAFPGGDGAYPYAGLASDSDGALYGTTSYGGAYLSGQVFRLSSSSGHWIKTAIYDFKGKADGGDPTSSLIFDQSGNIYGTTNLGGAICDCGTVFELKTEGNGKWTEETLYSFTANPSHVSSLTFDKAGNLYGTTQSGGKNGYGTVFELSPSGTGQWTEQTLYSFPGYDGDGLEPLSGVVFDDAGNLYGTTVQGGTYAGTLFMLNQHTGAWNETILHKFGCGSDGCYPQGNLLFNNGVLYGVTSAGGSRENAGTVFALAISNAAFSETVLYSFGGSPDGAYPEGGLVLDADGNLYGTTFSGGPSNDICNGGCGTAFELSPTSSGNWTETQILAFSPGLGGIGPAGGIIFGPGGDLYGTTLYGGGDAGTVFKIVP